MENNTDIIDQKITKYLSSKKVPNFTIGDKSITTGDIFRAGYEQALRDNILWKPVLSNHTEDIGRGIIGLVKVVATTDIDLIEDGIPSISQEFMQQYVQSQGEGVVYMETEEKDINQYIDNDCSFGYTIEAPKLDKAGNAVLSIEQEVNTQLLEDSTEIVNNEAIAFADWLLVNYVNTINNQWRKFSSDTTYTSKELYNIWQQRK